MHLGARLLPHGGVLGTSLSPPLNKRTARDWARRNMVSGEHINGAWRRRFWLPVFLCLLVQLACPLGRVDAAATVFEEFKVGASFLAPGKSEIMYVGGSWPRSGAYGPAGGQGQAVMMALETINRDPNLLPGIELRVYVANDNCDGSQVGVILVDLLGSGKPIVGIGLGQCSGVSRTWGLVTKSFNMMVIDAASESPRLSDKVVYPYYMVRICLARPALCPPAGTTSPHCRRSCAKEVPGSAVQGLHTFCLAPVSSRDAARALLC